MYFLSVQCSGHCTLLWPLVKWVEARHIKFTELACYTSHTINDSWQLLVIIICLSSGTYNLDIDLRKLLYLLLFMIFCIKFNLIFNLIKTSCDKWIVGDCYSKCICKDCYVVSHLERPREPDEQREESVGVAAARRLAEVLHARRERVLYTTQ